jgi:predicted O-methyltransferase YrrM
MINLVVAGMIGSSKQFPNEWMSLPELEWLARRASDCRVIAEIGVWKGRSTRAMADNTEGNIFAVDPWSNNPEHFKHGGFGGCSDSFGEPVQMEDIFQEFRINLKDHLGSTVIPVRMLSVDAAAYLGSLGIRFDMVFIDGMHGYDYVKEDIQAWMPLLNPGGLLCGHDYHTVGEAANAPSVLGLRRAVEELVPDFQLLDGEATGTVYPRCCIWWKQV